VLIANANNCRFYQREWDGYGANKNKGISLAKYDWILSIDADEVPDEELIQTLHQLKLDDPLMVYDIKFRSYFGEKLVRFGNWGRDHHIRLFNRTLVKWSEPNVHETLILPKQAKVKRIKGHLHHYSSKNADECRRKAIYYAHLSAENYFQRGKRYGIGKLYASSFFSFIKSYFLLLGFLDGRKGYIIAKMLFKNRWLKYHYLRSMNKHKGVPQPLAEPSLTVEYQ
jgi:glycosyltransferase involved in cell wall biosynthesis